MGSEKSVQRPSPQDSYSHKDSKEEVKEKDKMRNTLQMLAEAKEKDKLKILVSSVAKALEEAFPKHTG